MNTKVIPSIANLPNNKAIRKVLEELVGRDDLGDAYDMYLAAGDYASLAALTAFGLSDDAELAFGDRVYKTHEFFILGLSKEQQRDVLSGVPANCGGTLLAEQIVQRCFRSYGDHDNEKFDNDFWVRMAHKFRGSAHGSETSHEWVRGNGLHVYCWWRSLGVSSELAWMKTFRLDCAPNIPPPALPR